MTRLLLAVAGAYGVFLLYTAVAFGWRGAGVSPGLGRRSRRRADVQQWLAQAGLDGVRPSQFFAAVALIFGQEVTFDWSASNDDDVVLRVRGQVPRVVLPSMGGGQLPFGDIDRTVRLRVERFR